MKKRMTISIISIVSAVLLLCGWTAFASSSSGTTTSSSMTGTFKSISENAAQVTITTDKGEQTIALAKSVWVYRNGQKAQLSDLKPGDQVEVVVNSKSQAAYLKASSEAPAAPAPQPAEPGPAADEQTKPPVPAPQQPNPAAQAAPTKDAGQPDSAVQANSDIELKLDDNLNIQLNSKAQLGQHGKNNEHNDDQDDDGEHNDDHRGGYNDDHAKKVIKSEWKHTQSGKEHNHHGQDD